MPLLALAIQGLDTHKLSGTVSHNQIIVSHIQIIGHAAGLKQDLGRTPAPSLAYISVQPSSLSH